MSYLRERKGGKGRKIAILILKKLTFAGFREIIHSRMVDRPIGRPLMRLRKTKTCTKRIDRELIVDQYIALFRAYLRFNRVSWVG